MNKKKQGNFYNTEQPSPQKVFCKWKVTDTLEAKVKENEF